MLSLAQFRLAASNVAVLLGFTIYIRGTKPNTLKSVASSTSCTVFRSAAIGNNLNTCAVLTTVVGQEYFVQVGCRGLACVQAGATPCVSAHVCVPVYARMMCVLVRLLRALRVACLF